MTRYLLDTNIISHLVRAQPEVVRRTVAVPMAAICMSSITEGELLYGLAKRHEAAKLHRIVEEILQRVEVLPWDRDAARHYGVLRARLERSGTILAPLDLLIAAQALAHGMVLVTNDQVFERVSGLAIEDWTQAA